MVLVVHLFFRIGFALPLSKAPVATLQSKLGCLIRHPVPLFSGDAFGWIKQTKHWRRHWKSTWNEGKVENDEIAVFPQLHDCHLLSPIMCLIFINPDFYSPIKWNRKSFSCVLQSNSLFVAEGHPHPMETRHARAHVCIWFFQCVPGKACFLVSPN